MSERASDNERESERKRNVKLVINVNRENVRTHI